MKSFDFDGTLQGYDGKPIQRVIDLIDEDSIIVTRQEPNPNTELFAIALGIPVYFTSGDWKWKKLKELGVTEHYDDDPTEIELIKKNTDIKTHFVDDDKSHERQVKLLKVKLKSIHACIVDYGLHVELALTLAKDYGIVDYYCPWKEDYPKSVKRNIGTGFKDINRIYEFTDDYIDSVDLFVFPCILDGTVQTDLVKRGKLVWGSRDAELMEIDRKQFIEFQKKIGLPVPPTEYVTGISELRKYLNESTGIKYVKANSNTRGDIETFKVDDREIAEQYDLKELEHDLGHSAETKELIVQDNIEGVIAEIGYDGFVIDGKFPDTALFGIEVKDMGYIGKVVPYEKLPAPVKFTNQKLSAALKADGMRGNISTEIKDVGDDKGYLIDPTMRFPYPPCNILLSGWENIAECIYKGAGGELVDMKFKDKFAIEVEMFSDTAKHKEFWLKYPEELSEYIKIPYCMYDGKKITLPQEVKNNNVGSIVVWGESLESCKKKAMEVADQIKGHHLHIDFNCLDSAITELKKL